MQICSQPLSFRLGVFDEHLTVLIYVIDCSKFSPSLAKSSVCSIIRAYIFYLSYSILYERFFHGLWHHQTCHVYEKEF